MCGLQIYVPCVGLTQSSYVGMLASVVHHTLAKISSSDGRRTNAHISLIDFLNLSVFPVRQVVLEDPVRVRGQRARRHWFVVGVDAMIWEMPSCNKKIALTTVARLETEC
jgi:hypothetical protein